MNDILKFKEEYEKLNLSTGVVMDINIENHIIYKTAAEIVNILNNETGIVYFGFAECPWCRNAIPVLLETADKTNIPIYYLSIKGLHGPDFREIFNILDKYLIEENGKKEFYVPDMYFIKEGKIMGHHLSTVDSQNNPRIPMNIEQKEELKKVYQDLINKVI